MNHTLNGIVVGFYIICIHVIVLVDCGIDVTQDLKLLQLRNTYFNVMVDGSSK